jgi:hypothetical protein
MITCFPLDLFRVVLQEPLAGHDCKTGMLRVREMPLGLTEPSGLQAKAGRHRVVMENFQYKHSGTSRIRALARWIRPEAGAYSPVPGMATAKV